MHITGKRYNDYGSYIRMQFGERVQKISIDCGFSCPNRDGTKGYGGCTYCNNNSFSPDYCGPSLSIREQLEKGIAFFKRRNNTSAFLAYFQAYTNTYAQIDILKSLYEEALNVPGVRGIIIGTRPDCVSDELISYLSELSNRCYVALEMGVESTLDKTLIKVNRCHSYQETVDAFNRCCNQGFQLGAHLILGLPGETRSDLLSHAGTVSELPIDFLKLHHLQIIKKSVMHAQFLKDASAFNLFEKNDYLELLGEFLCQLRPDIIIERFISESPNELLVAPRWGLKNFEIVSQLDKYLDAMNFWQGKSYVAL